MRLFTQALALDPQNSSALAMLLGCHAHRRSFGLVIDAEQEKAQVAELVRIAVRCDDANAVAHAAYAIGTVLRDLAFAEEQSKRALVLNPNLAEAWPISGWVNYLSGNPALAVEHALHALRLDPLFVNAYRRSSLANAYFFSDRYREAFRWAEKHLRDAPETHVALRIGAASAAFAGMTEVAQQLGARLERIDPAFRVSRLEDYIGPYRLPEYVEKLKQGLRLAGLPE
jgi:tetratricopeptide (TPR) repeat protein